MAGNKMNEVAKLLGLELEEEFRLLFVNTFSNGIYKLNKRGLVFKAKDNRNWQTTNKLHCLLNGDCEIIKLPKPILDDAEKEYLSAVIKPFKDKVISIANYYEESIDNNFIEIEVKQNYCNENQYVSLPYFKKGTMYKGMEEHKKYTLEELGL